MMLPEAEDVEFEEHSDSDNDSDKELQVAFQKGLLKDLVIETTQIKRQRINNKIGLEEALKNLKKNLPWQETLDICTEPTPLPQCLKGEEVSTDDITENEFKLENQCYRQAQAAVLKGLSRLAAFNISTKRPEDYFAEMVKSDVHMKKVKENLLTLQAVKEKSEKARKEREAKKLKKLANKEDRKIKKKEKLEYKGTLKKLKKKMSLGQQGKPMVISNDDADVQNKTGATVKYRKNQKNIKKQQQQNSSSGETTPKANKRRIMKNDRFGFGGQKKRSKYNTRDSVDEVKFKTFRSTSAKKPMRNKNKSNHKNRDKKKR